MTCSISVFGAIIVVTAVTPTIMFAILALSLVYYQVQVQPHLFLLVFSQNETFSNRTLLKFSTSPAVPQNFSDGTLSTLLCSQPGKLATMSATMPLNPLNHQV